MSDSRNRAVSDFEINHFLQQLKDAPDDVKRELWNQMRAFALPEADDATKVRVLSNGSPVTDTASGSRVGFKPDSYFDILNFIGTAMVNSRTNGRQADIYLGGGSDCMFDHLVSSCWATMVAAGQGAEGDTFVSLTGCTFRVWSTVKGAIDWIASASNTVDHAHVPVFICPGTYTESAITWPTVATSNADSISLIGSATPTDNATNPGVVLTTAGGANLFTMVTNPINMHARDITFSADGAGKAWARTSGVNFTATFDRCRFGKAVDLDNWLEATFNDCWIDAAMSCGSGAGIESLRFNDCFITAAINLASATGIEEVTFNEGCRHLGSSATVTIGDVRMFRHAGTFVVGSAASDRIVIAGGTGLAVGFEITSEFRDAPTSGGAVVRVTTGGGTTEVFNGRIAALFTGPTGAVSATTAFVKLTGLTGSRISGVSVVGCVFGYGANDFSSIEAKGGFSVIGAFVENCAFGPNAPATKALYSITNAGTGATANEINGIQQGTAAPTHTANEGVLYNDRTANILYVNTDGATTWAAILTSGSVSTFFSIVEYVFMPDAAPGVTITAGDAQGVILHSGPGAETATRIYADYETAPGAATQSATAQYGDTDDLDTVASWTTIAAVTNGNGVKSNLNDTMTNAAIPANRLLRCNFAQSEGADGSVTLRAKRPLTV